MLREDFPFLIKDIGLWQKSNVKHCNLHDKESVKIKSTNRCTKGVCTKTKKLLDLGTITDDAIETFDCHMMW